MNAIKYTGIVAAGALLASSAAFAGPDWTFIEGAFYQGNELSQNGDNDNDAYSLGGSFGFADMYHVQAEYIDGEAGAGNDSDYDGYELTFGVNPAVTDNTDFVAQAFYADIDASDFSGVGAEGYGVRMGLRSMYTDKVELSAYGVFRDSEFDNTDLEGTQVGAEIGGQYYWTEAFSVGLDALLADSTALRFSARWNF